MIGDEALKEGQDAKTVRSRIVSIKRYKSDHKRKAFA